MCNGSFQEILQELRKKANNSTEQGTYFEKLICEFLKIDPVYKGEFENVWLWKNWPNRNNRPDTGVDIVAESYNGEIFAIQCKFYDQNYELQKRDIDSFLNELGRNYFHKGIIFATTNNWSRNAENALKNRSKECIRVDFYDLEQSNIDWKDLLKKEKPRTSIKKKVRPHQKDAIDGVVKGFKKSKIGKMIMPCGTGKTFTSLKIAEKILPPNGSVLFLVPSLSLISQTLREWSNEAQRPIRNFVVCSDSRVGRNEDEDIQSSDLVLPPTTKYADLAKKINESFNNKKPKVMNIIFSTYQSIKVISNAQKKKKVRPFDLIICDEAHRTTGAKERNNTSSSFTKVHDENFIKSKKRLFMTATPRIYSESSKKKASKNKIEVFSMDDKNKYGNEFYRMDFSKAIEKDLLVDYKVCIFTVNEEELDSTMANSFSQNRDINTSDAAKIIGCWNALAKRSLSSTDWVDPSPIKKAVAFLGTIRKSKKLKEYFDMIIKAFKINNPHVTDALECIVHHVDGTQNVLKRNEELRWLKDEPLENECRILSNARCLSEGIDIPALDAVMFLNPRKSYIDIIQSVGRVMRKAEGKNYGYIILPIIIRREELANRVLDDNTAYAAVWQVLQALRSHDDRFDTMINQIELNKKRPPQIIIGGSGTELNPEDETGPNKTLSFDNLPIGKLRESIYAKLVLKCGDRQYWDKWAKDIAEAARTNKDRVNNLKEQNKKTKVIFNNFLNGLRENLNLNLSEEDAVEMLAQHIITKPIFDALFEGYDFAKNNPISKNMEKIVKNLENQTYAETKDLEGFYENIRRRVRDVDNAEGKQKIMKDLYEKFFQEAFPKMVKRLGIIYTPIEVVDFILKSSDDLLRQEFGEGLTNENVHILDPFLGTGTFLSRLFQSDLIKDEDLERKYRSEIHANEIVLLAYYIGAINIESSYYFRKKKINHGDEYKAFENMILTDTFQTGEDRSQGSGNPFQENKNKIEKQKKLPLKLITGNPPYSVGQESENDNNRNLGYPKLDKKIQDTYVQLSNAGLSRNLYDSYIRAIRWASDRIEKDGMIAFITNGNFIDTKSMDGLRASLAEEFSSIYIINLKGDLRRGGEEAGEGIFPIKTPVAISFFIKNQKKKKQKCLIKYHDIGNALKKEEKIERIKKFGSLIKIENWKEIQPDKHHDWINQRSPDFESFVPMESLKIKKGIFSLSSLGVVTNRDSWVYNYDKKKLIINVKKTINFYNAEVERYAKNGKKKDDTWKSVDEFINNDSTKISWSSDLKKDFKRKQKHKYNKKFLTKSLYRPFTKQWLYYYKGLNERHYQTQKIFPIGVKNLAICVSGDKNNYAPLMCDILPNLDLLPGSKIFSRYTYEKTGDQFKKHDNMNPEIINEFREHYKDKKINGDAVFYYIYALLHSKDYRKKYGNNLRVELPCIPFVSEFWKFSKIGKELSNLHINWPKV